MLHRHNLLLTRVAFVTSTVLACGDPTVVETNIERPNPVVVSVSDGQSGETLGDAELDVTIDTGDSARPDDTLAPIDAPLDATTDDMTAAEATPADTALDTQAVETASDAGADGETATALFPFVVEGDTARSTSDRWDRYACSPDTDESGPEDVYTFEIAELGILRAQLDDVAGDATDVDVHLLSGATPDTCVRRDNAALAWVVRPGTWTIAVDTWVGGDGVARVGRYRLDVSFIPLGSGRCALDDIEQRMFWTACAPGPNALDCTDDGTTRRLRVPSMGPVVGEAHLVTVDESFAGDGWPTALRDQIPRHYAISEAATGYVMTRDEPWAPEGEGGSHWGGGATGQKLPVLDEAWYVNMYWRDRPARGRRMLVVEPWTGRAVVAAGGWETGPGSNTAIGGAVEEVHHHLGSSHRKQLVMGFLTDDTLPLGPITCW